MFWIVLYAKTVCAVPEGTRVSSLRYPALKRWAKLFRPIRGWFVYGSLHCKPIQCRDAVSGAILFRPAKRAWRTGQADAQQNPFSTKQILDFGCGLLSCGAGAPRSSPSVRGAVPEGTRVSLLRLPSADTLGYLLSSRKAGLRFIAVTADRELSLGSQIHLETKIPTLAKRGLGWATRILQWLPSFWGMRFLLTPFIPAT